MSSLKNPLLGISTLSALAVTLLLGTLATAPPAAAWTSEGMLGQVGAVTPPPVSVSDIGFYPQALTLTFNSSVGPIVQRSPATTDAQNVISFYLVERWTGSTWNTVTSQRHAARIEANQNTAQFPAVFIQPTSGTGDYRFTFSVHWFPDGQSVSLGDLKPAPNDASDLVCVTTRRPCTQYAGHITIGPIK
ncbi:hypothetical protein [Streptomyces goshikiensis]|uniref:hypothetical protein n=1 Tax=Streptomyces goshikiensis TaxID=1942 RepID=UPI0036A81274